MHPYPHVYRVSAAGNQTGPVTVASPQLLDIKTATPPEFDERAASGRRRVCCARRLRTVSS